MATKKRQTAPEHETPPDSVRSQKTRSNRVLSLPAPKKREYTPDHSEFTNPDYMATTQDLMIQLQPMASRYKLSIEKIEAAMDDDALGAGTEILKTLVRVVGNAIPYAENNVIVSQGSKGVHALTQILGTARSLTHDLITLSDRANVGERVFLSNVEPMLRNIATQLMLAFAELESSAKPKMTQEDFKVYQNDLSKTRHALGQYMNAAYRATAESVKSSMS